MVLVIYASGDMVHITTPEFEDQLIKELVACDNDMDDYDRYEKVITEKSPSVDVDVKTNIGIYGSIGSTIA